MGSIVIVAQQLDPSLVNPLREEAPDDEDLVPIGEAMGTRPPGPAPAPDEVPWADDEETEDPGLDVQPEQPIPPPPGEQPPEEPVEPEKSFDELEEPKSEVELANEKADVRQKIWFALNNPGVPLRIQYTSLAGHASERTVSPDYVYWAGTRRHVMVAWCHMRNDWRAFIVNNITKAQLEEPNEK